jgi:hypothetical protein
MLGFNNMRFSNSLILAGAILLPWLLIPEVLFGQRLQDTTKVYSLQEVAVTEQKIDNRLLLQRIITEKRLRFRDTEIPYMLIQENMSNHQFDTLSDVLILNFKDQQLSDAYSISYFKDYHEPDTAWVLALYSIFDRFVFAKRSFDDMEVFKGNGKVLLTTDRTKRKFSLFGFQRLKDKLVTIYHFDNSGSSKICGYYHGRFKYNKAGEIIFLSDSTTVLPYEISVYRHYFNYRLYLRRIDINLDKQTRTPIRITKLLISILTH